jgi:hypothetical protein
MYLFIISQEVPQLMKALKKIVQQTSSRLEERQFSKKTCEPWIIAQQLVKL